MYATSTLRFFIVWELTTTGSSTSFRGSIRSLPVLFRPSSCRDCWRDRAAQVIWCDTKSAHSNCDVTMALDPGSECHAVDVAIHYSPGWAAAYGLASVRWPLSSFPCASADRHARVAAAPRARRDDPARSA